MLRSMAMAGCVVCGIAADASAQLKAIPYASGLSAPVAFVQDPTDRTIQFVVQQAGRIRAIRNGTVLATDFINLSGSISCCGERGLLGLAFAPDTHERPLLCRLHQPGGHTASRDSVDRAILSSRIRARVSTCGGAAPPAPRSSRSHTPTTTAAT
jgi:hypothetical protein